MTIKVMKAILVNKWNGKIILIAGVSAFELQLYNWWQGEWNSVIKTFVCMWKRMHGILE